MSATVVIPFALGAGSATIVRPSGVNRPFRTSADTAAARGTALADAVAAAVSGETIIVGPGSYTITASLAKNGVNWWFAEGAVVTWTAGTTGCIWDDGNTAMSYKVDGHGRFIRRPDLYLNATTQTAGVYGQKHASTDVSFNFDSVRLELVGDGNFNSDEQAKNYSVIGVQAGAFKCRGRRLELDYELDPSGVLTCGGLWWKNGEFNADIQEIVTVGDAGSGGDLWLIWSQVTATPTGDFRVKAQKIGYERAQGANADYVYGSNGNQATAAAWVESTTMKGLISHGTGKHYFTTQKLIGGMYPSGGLSYLRANKVGGSGAGGGYLFDNQAGGTYYLNVDHWEPDAGIAGTINVVAGTVSIDSQDIPAPVNQIGGAGQTATITVNGTGVLNLLSGVVSGSGTHLARSAGTLNVASGVVYDTTKTSGTITRTDKFLSIAQTFTAAQTFSGGITIDSLSGVLKATGGVVSGGATISNLSAPLGTAGFIITSGDGGIEVTPYTSSTWSGNKITEAYGGTNQSTYATGDVLYASTTNTLSKLPGNTTTTTKLLSQKGTGSISASPSWFEFETVTAYGSGTAGNQYTLTATYAAVTFGSGTQPAVTLTSTGKWRLESKIRFNDNGAEDTFQVDFKLRKTSGTAADVTNAVAQLYDDLFSRISAAGIRTFELMTDEVYYNGTINDVITLFGRVASVPAAGALEVVRASVKATKIG